MCSVWEPLWKLYPSLPFLVSRALHLTSFLSLASVAWTDVTALITSLVKSATCSTLTPRRAEHLTPSRIVVPFLWPAHRTGKLRRHIPHSYGWFCCSSISEVHDPHTPHHSIQDYIILTRIFVLHLLCYYLCTVSLSGLHLTILHHSLLRPLPSSLQTW